MSKTRFLLPLILALATCSGASTPQRTIFDDVFPKVFPQEKIVSTSDNLSFKLPEDIRPIHYDITLIPVFNTSDETNFTFTGKSVIELYVKNNTNKITFHAKNLELNSSIKYKNNTTKFLGIETIIKDEERNFVTLVLNETVKHNDTLILTLDFTGKLDNDLRGFYRSSYKNEKGEEIWLGTTHFEPVGARKAFPCWDQPDIKAHFTITIKHSDEYRAISNMKINKDETTTNTTTVFNMSPKMPSYLVAFVVSNFESNTVEDKNFTFGVWTKPQAINSTDFALKIGQQVLKELEDYTKISYEKDQGMQKMDQISIPDFAAGAMENWGLVTYRESALLYTNNKTTTESKQSIATVIAHEFSHQWFGNLVTCEWWDYIWLNEGFATFFQYFITDKVMQNKSEDWRLMEQFAIKNLQASAFVVDASSKTRALNPKNSVKTPAQISSLFDDIAYKKGASIIRMMQQFLGEDVFRNGLNKYLTAYAFEAVNSTHLFKAIQNEIKDKYDLKAYMKNWVDEPGYPVVSVTRVNDTYLNLTQERFYLEQPTNPDKTEWYIPIDYVTQDAINVTEKIWLKPGEALYIENDVNNNTWILLNKDQTGYYRVNYNEENWKRLKTFLETNDEIHISAVNRAQLIDDALNLARGGYLKYNVALSMTVYLSKETDYIPWYAAVRAFNYLDNVLQNATADYHKYVASKIANFAKSVRYEEYNGTHVNKLAKVLALNTACKYGLKACNEFVKNKLDTYLNNKETLPTDLRSGILCAGLRTANNETLQKALEKHKNVTDEDEKADILAGLGCVTSKEVINEFLNSILKTNSQILLLDAMNSVCTGNVASFNVLIKFIVENIKKIQNENPDALAAHFNKLANRVTTIEQYIELMSLVTRMLSEEVQRASLNVGLALENIAWIKRYQKEVAKWIEENRPEEQPEPTTTAKPDSANSLTLTFSLVIIPMLLTRL